MSQLRKNIPYRSLGNTIASLGIILASYFLGGYSLGVSVVFGIICYLAYRLFLGGDARKEDQWENLDALSTQYAQEQITKARAFMVEIQELNKKISSKRLSIKLDSLSDIGHDIIALFEDDPADLKRSRRFIEVYLSGAVSVSHQFADLSTRTDDKEVYEQYKDFLDEMLNAFSKHYEALLDDDKTNIDIEIEILKKRIKTEDYD